MHHTNSCLASLQRKVERQSQVSCVSVLEEDHWWGSKWKKYIEISKSSSQKEPHLILRATQHNSRDVRRAHVKARLLCGAYILQTNRAIFNQTRDVTCPLCNQAEESITHFLIECEKLEPVRRAPLQCLKDIIPLVYQDHPETNWSSELLTQLVLDPTHPHITNILPFNQRMLI